MQDFAFWMWSATSALRGTWRPVIPVLVCALVAVAGCVAPVEQVPAAGPTRTASANVVDPFEVIALVPITNRAATLKSGAQARGFRLQDDTPLDGIGLRMLRFSFPPPLDGKGAIDVLESLDGSATAGVNHVYRIATSAGASGLDYANELMAWPSEVCRAQGPVGMIDTGIDGATVQGLGGTVISRDFVRDGESVTRHGTDVASVLLDPRRVSSVTLYNASVVGRTRGGGQTAGVDSILLALDWLAAEGVRVVNVSLAGPYNKLLDKGMDRAISAGMVVVAAVGNDGASAPPRYPAALDNVIAVTAVDANRRIYRRAVRGGHVNIAAPGVDIPVTASDATRFVSGTSMAVPFVTARIATDPALYGRNAAVIRAALSRSAEDLGAPGVDDVFGSGLLRARPSC